jgi:hypothetical protein
MDTLKALQFKGLYKMKNRTITVYSDPGHAWAKVSRSELIRLGLIDKISTYSYQRKGFVYLEEDRDLGLYIVALRDAGATIKFKEMVSRERQSKIRGYDYFRVEGMTQQEFQRIYEKNEDENRHSDNAVLLAEYIGSAADIAEAKSIRSEHERLGGLNEDLYQRRNALCAKLWNTPAKGKK